MDKDGTRYITLLRMSLSPLKKHKFDHNFNDTPDIICPSGDGIENTEHFLLLCKSFRDIRATLMQNVSNIMRVNFDIFPNKRKIEYLLYGCGTLQDDSNKMIIKETICYIRKSKRFDKYVS